MDCIIAPKFIEQPKEVQEKLKIYVLDNLGDFTEFAKPIGETGSYEIFYLAWIERNEATFISLMDGKQVNKSVFNLKDFIPLFTETQLRKFIEERTNGHVDCAYYAYKDNGFRGYTIKLWSYSPYKCIKQFKDLGDDLIQAYWQVAVKIIMKG